MKLSKPAMWSSTDSRPDGGVPDQADVTLIVLTHKCEIDALWACSARLLHFSGNDNIAATVAITEAW